MITDVFLPLFEHKVITNRKKTLFPGRVLTSMCMGSEKIFRYIDNNPMFYFRSSEYVNDPTVIALNDNLISISSALEVDLTGQVCTDSMVHLFYNGIAELSGKSIYQRVMELAQIAHPKFREELIEVAKSRHYIFADQLPPIQDDLIFLEGYKNQMALKNGKIAEFRPLLPSDEFAYRKFFYSLQERTIYSRFFYKIKLFSHELAQKQWASVDYHKNMSMIGQVRVGGRQEIVAIGSYADEGEEASRAEIAFVVREDFQGMGIASYLLSIMQRIAKQNNFTGFMATVLRENKAMLQVFKKRYPNAKTSIEAGNYVNILMDFSDAVEHGHMVSSNHPIEDDICICPVSKEKK
ncbi:acetyl-CoA hydrolase/transferase family protein [Desulfosarcina variabilis str. Montpellier]|uniref:GNAT family N-acetyltransferase n=1 Tax=Desulfosarcina variabilis TaxID=2300 RepID=UPI003AFB01F5